MVPILAGVAPDHEDIVLPRALAQTKQPHAVLQRLDVLGVRKHALGQLPAAAGAGRRRRVVFRQLGVECFKDAAVGLGLDGRVQAFAPRLGAVDLALRLL